MPLPYTLDVVGTTLAGRACCEDCPPDCDVVSAAVALLNDGVELPRTSRCLSSVSSSLSSPSASNASARSGSTLFRRSRDDARDRKDGGGEFGIGYVGLGKGAVGVSGSSSWAFTCDAVNLGRSQGCSVDIELNDVLTRSYRPDMLEDVQ